MAEIKIDSRPFGRDTKNPKEIKIVIRITHKNLRRFVYTGIKVAPNQFDGTMVINHTRATILNSSIMKKLSDCLLNQLELSGNTDNMDIDTFTRIVTRPRIEGMTFTTGVSVLHAIDGYVTQLKKEGKKGTAHTYETTRAVVFDWWKGENLDFAMLNAGQLKALRDWMAFEKKYSLSTISIHERNIRTIFNREIKAKRIPIGVYPFNEHKVLVSNETEHRNLSLKKLKAIRDLDCSGLRPVVREARDIFMLSFYMVGINLVDLWHLSDCDVEDGVVRYFRQKTRHEYSFTIIPEAWDIINKYKGRSSLLLFRERIQHYDSWKKEVNKCLKEIGQHEKVKVPRLTYYHARHSWASLAFGEAGVSIPEVAVALGHGKRTVTNRYIDIMYNKKVIDDANSKVIALLSQAEIKGKP